MQDRPTPPDVQQQQEGSGRELRRIGETLRMYRRGAEALVELWSHPRGWEVRLKIDDQLVRSAVCHSHEAVTSQSEAWSAELTDDGWQ